MPVQPVEKSKVVCAWAAQGSPQSKVRQMGVKRDVRRCPSPAGIRAAPRDGKVRGKQWLFPWTSPTQWRRLSYEICCSRNLDANVCDFPFRSSYRLLLEYHTEFHQDPVLCVGSTLDQFAQAKATRANCWPRSRTAASPLSEVRPQIDANRAPTPLQPSRALQR